MLIMASESEPKTMQENIERWRDKYPSLYEIWNSPPLSEEQKQIDLRQNCFKKWDEYTLVFQQAVLNNVAWMKKNDITLDIPNISSGVMKVDDKIVGYDFLVSTPAKIPCMTPQEAAFPYRYAQVLPALMLVNFMKHTRSEKVDLTVLCQGYGFTDEEKWWVDEASGATADDAAGFLVDSEEFKSYVNKEIVQGKVKRLCVWIFCIGHVFMVVWERGAQHDVIYFCDNVKKGQGCDDICDFRNEFLACFSQIIDDIRSKDTTVKKFNLLSRSLFSTRNVEIQSDLVCVSFVARSTAYLNTMDVFVDTDAIKFIANIADPRFHALVYNKFEDSLFDFLKNYLLIEGRRDNSGYFSSACVWLPSVMQNKFVNINDIHLLMFYPEEAGVASATRFEFSFDKASSFKAVLTDTDTGSIDISERESYDKRDACTFMAAFTPSITPLVTLNAAASDLRECRKALDEAMGLMARPQIITVGEGTFFI